MINKQIGCSVQWFVSVFLFFFFVHTALCQMEPTVNNVFGYLIHAVEEDNNEAYRAARSVALRLDEQQFDTLLNMLEKAETWQALAVKNGLRVRREHPGLSAEFDKHLDWLRNNPIHAVVGPMFRWRDERNMFASAEGDWLRYEAALTEKADLPKDGRSIPSWIPFRRAVFGSGRHADDMRFRIMMLRDMPGWLPHINILSGLPGSIRRSPHRVDMYVPELVEHHKRIRQAHGDLQLHATSSTFFRLMEAIAEADTDIALPALKQIREFEQTTGEEIQQSRDAQLQARLQVIEELSEQALREGREEDARKLTMERPGLRRARARNVGPSVRRRLDELIEKIEKHREAAEQQ